MLFIKTNLSESPAVAFVEVLLIDFGVLGYQVFQAAGFHELPPKFPKLWGS